MKKIQLKNNIEILVDDEIYEDVVSHKWNICNAKGKNYIRTTVYYPKKANKLASLARARPINIISIFER
jgi:hypothetical protein